MAGHGKSPVPSGRYAGQEERQSQAQSQPSYRVGGCRCRDRGAGGVRRGSPAWSCRASPGPVRAAGYQAALRSSRLFQSPRSPVRKAPRGGNVTLTRPARPALDACPSGKPERPRAPRAPRRGRRVPGRRPATTPRQPRTCAPRRACAARARARAALARRRNASERPSPQAPEAAATPVELDIRGHADAATGNPARRAGGRAGGGRGPQEGLPDADVGRGRGQRHLQVLQGVRRAAGGRVRRRLVQPAGDVGRDPGRRAALQGADVVRQRQPQLRHPPHERARGRQAVPGRGDGAHGAAAAVGAAGVAAGPRGQEGRRAAQDQHPAAAGLDQAHPLQHPGHAAAGQVCEGSAVMALRTARAELSGQ